MSKHEWVNLYETCGDCNCANHRCHFCGHDLDHEGYQGDGTRHWVEDCRPDLVEHEPGPLCTWPDNPDLNEFREPDCYWDHEKNELKS